MIVSGHKKHGHSYRVNIKLGVSFGEYPFENEKQMKNK